MRRKSVFISLLGHLTIFSIFSLSFGSRIPKADFPGVYFWGALLGRAQVAAPLQPAHKTTLTKIPISGDYFPARDLIIRREGHWREKPPFSLMFNPEKETPLRVLFSLPALPEKREPMILFHPLLPYGFSLYFKDRQVAHVELMFNIESAGLGNSIAVKRRISSGNLEVDLLCMRYIGHYLFIEQARFAPNKWQTVKIDLSKKDD